MMTNRLSNIFLLTAPLVMSGCSIIPHTDLNNCTSGTTYDLKIPLITESALTAGHYGNNSCKAGDFLASSALMGRKENGTLLPASILIWHDRREALEEQISKAPAGSDEVKKLEEIKTFADLFIQKRSQEYGGSLVTSEMVKSMFKMKVTDPTIFTSDGKYIPPQALCTGQSMIRICGAPKTAPQAAPTPE